MIKFYLSLSRYLTVFLVCISSFGFAQQITVSGKVTSADDGAPVPGANVLEKGTTNGTATDANGEFKINVNPNATLSITFVGYKTQEVAVGSQTTINVVLVSDITSLAEVVVVGYGTQEKKDVTGSVAAVGTSDFNRGVISSPQDMLVGKVAGVQITTNNGAPGSGSTIRIRGTNSVLGSSDPLFVIDGFAVDNSSTSNIPGLANPLALLNPNDIESVTVLKDASATAIYGLRGSNGVIVITTKKGKEGKPQFTFNSNVSISTPQKYYDVMDARQYRSFIRNNFANIPSLNANDTLSLGKANTNWQKEIYRAAVSFDENLGVSGSYKNVPYRVSYGYTDQEGILKTTNFVRNSINLNLTPSFLNGDLQATISIKAMNTQQNFGNTGAIGSAVSFDPTQSVHSSNAWGDYYYWSDNSGNPIPIAPKNPVALLDQTDNKSNVNRGIATLKLDYRLKFFPDIKLTLNTGVDYSKSTGHNNSPNNAAFTYAGSNSNGKAVGYRDYYTGDNRSRLLDLYANYFKVIGKHKVDVTVGHSYQAFEIYSSNFSKNGQTPPVYADYSLGSDGTTAIAHQAVPQLNYILSFFGRANYSYNDRYLLTLSMRDDASSRFSKQNRWTIFPSAAIGWKINKESFMSSVKFVSDLKLRGSWGVTGNQALSGLNGTSQNPSYPYLGLYQQGTGSYQYQFGSGFVTTQRPQAYDANLKWEKSTQVDVGLDFGFLNNRISGTVDVYQKNTSDLINQIPSALGSNFSNSIITNVGTLTNKGIEFTLRAQVVKTQGFEWNFGFNIAHNENKITKLIKNNDPNFTGNMVGGISGGLGGTIQNIQVGYPINSYFVFQQVYDNSGRPIEGAYVDVSGNGGSVIGSNLNKIRFHSPQAKALIGINSKFNYKNFDFYFQGRISLGNYVYNNIQSANAYLGNLHYSTGFFNNLPSAVNDTKFIQPQTYSSYYVQDASFFRMDNMSLGYNLNQISAIQRLKARVAFTVQNAFFITKYKGIDPEVDGGIDNNLYPRPRVYMLSLNLTY